MSAAFPLLSFWYPRRSPFPLWFFLTLWGLVFLLTAHARNAFSAEATVAWDPNTEATLAGYKVYYGTSSGSYPYDEDAGAQTQHTVSGLEAGSTYFFAATAYDAYGAESGFSQEVYCQVPQDTPSNRAPEASAGTLATVEDTRVAGVFCATDPDGDPLIFRVVALPALGSVTLTDVATGAFAYVPNPDANGTDVFTFAAGDGALESDAAPVTVTIAPVNDPPVALGDTASTLQDVPQTIQVLANDTDPDGDALVLASVQQPSHGVAVAYGAAVIYTPDLLFVGGDGFTYTVTDGRASASAAVTVTVLSAADVFPPAAVTDLAPANVTGSAVTLTWTAPGDDGTSGTAASYDIRCSSSPITQDNWEAAQQLSSPPVPAPPGTIERYDLGGLSATTTYWFALRTTDERSNWSALSNVPSATTGGIVHIPRLLLSLATRAGGRKQTFTTALATLTVVHASGKPAQGAAVSAHWCGLAAGTVSGVTNARGEVTLASAQVRNRTGVFTLVVDDVTLAASAYDPSANGDFDGDGTAGDTSCSITAGRPAAKTALCTALGLAYPNPANPSAHITYTTAGSDLVNLRVYNMLGQLVRTLVNEVRPPETRTVGWDGRDDSGALVAAGNYLFCLRAGAHLETRRVAVLR